MYGKRLKTYKRTGFSIWTGDEQTKQIINAIYDSGNYTEKFEQDIVEAEKSIVISSPDIRQDKIDRLLLLVTEVEERFAVIDDELVWHGGMNLLGKVDIWDNLMRIRNHQVAAELLDISLGTTTEAEGD
jgi:hypothetical protein